MKKTKKLAALFLALMMALSCMVMPAMAAGEDEDDEGIMLLGAVKPCQNCGEMVEIIIQEIGPSIVDAAPHGNVEIWHKHEILARYESYHCFACEHEMHHSRTILIACGGGQ